MKAFISLSVLLFLCVLPSLGQWTAIDGGATNITVDRKGFPWVVNNVGNIYRRTASGWVQLPGSANDIGAGGNSGNGNVWVIGTNSVAGGFGIFSYNFQQNTWTQIDGGAVRIAVDRQGNPWVVNNQNTIFRRTNNRWVQLPGAARDIGIGADGSVWVIGTNTVAGGFGIFSYNSRQNSWSQVDGGAVRIAVDRQGNPWVVNSQNNIFRRTRGRWVQLTGAARDIGAGADGSVWVVGTNIVPGGFGIFKYTG